LPDDKAVEVAQQLCAGLAAAHHSGVLHRDLKPANVMIDGKGRARITDFGLAVAAAEADNKSGPAGTPGYLAPELFAGAAPSVQSDLYGLGLVLYELFTGKKAFDASSVGEFYRKQTETNPTPPSNVVKNFDPAVERVILRCLDRDPAQRPRSALSVAAALPGGDPLGAALAAGETPAPEVVAAAGPEGSLRPAVAWACLVVAVTLIVFTSAFLGPRQTDWGLTAMNKSPEVLADRAQELAKKLGYPVIADRASWIDWDADYNEYLDNHLWGKEWGRAWAGRAWPSPVAFWYRQSPAWLTPEWGRVMPSDPPYQRSEMLTVKLAMDGHLLFLRAVPPQLDDGRTGVETDWNLLFAEAGLDRNQFVPASPKWVPPDAFDIRKDWEGHLDGRADFPLHVAAAGFHGKPTYFQVIAPWDRASRTAAVSSKTIDEISSTVLLLLILSYMLIGGFFARRNLRSGRGDAKGATRVAGFVLFVGTVFNLLRLHLALELNYMAVQLLLLGLGVFPALFVWIGYMAVEPYTRRSWPKLLVSWQRALSGRLRDPLVGRDVLLGALAGAAGATLLMASTPLTDASPANVDSSFGRGMLSALGMSVQVFTLASIIAFLQLVLLTTMTKVLRRRWLGMAATGLLLVVLGAPRSATSLAIHIFLAVLALAILGRVGMLGMVSYFVVSASVVTVPPLNFTQWYAGLAVIGLSVPLALLVYGFYVSLGGQPIFGRTLSED
jgi:serine/threonine-protein kinase